MIYSIHSEVIEDVMLENWPGNTVRIPLDGVPQIEWQADADNPPTDDEVNDACAAYTANGGREAKERQMIKDSAKALLRSKAPEGALLRALARKVASDQNQPLSQVLQDIEREIDEDAD